MIIHALVQATMDKRRTQAPARTRSHSGRLEPDKAMAWAGVIAFLGLAGLLTWVLLQFY